MGPKEGPSKRAIRDKKASLLEDATFGLKNKNKSKKVQQFISRVEKTVKHSHGGADAVRVMTDSSESKWCCMVIDVYENMLLGRRKRES